MNYHERVDKLTERVSMLRLHPGCYADESLLTLLRDMCNKGGIITVEVGNRRQQFLYPQHESAIDGNTEQNGS